MDEAFDAALGELADALAPLYDQRATITRPGLASDGAGGQRATVATIASNVPCLVAPTGFTREEREVGAALAAAKLWAISVPLSAVVGWVVRPEDAIVVDGRAYAVQNTDAGAGHAIELIITCVRLDPQAEAATASAFLLLEDGSLLLLEDGGRVLLEDAPPATLTALLLEDGSLLLLEDGGRVLLEDA